MRSLLESAALLGRWRYGELALFSLFGERAPSLSPPELSLFVAGAARAHGFRAALLEERLPVSAGLPRADEWTTSPSQTFEALLDALEKSDDEELAGALAPLYEAMRAGYAAAASSCSALSEDHLRRLFGRLSADLSERAREAAALPAGATSERLRALLAGLPTSGGDLGEPS